MTTQAIITTVVLVLAVIIFVTDKFSIGFTSLSALLILVLTGVVAPGDAFKNFINSNVIMIIAMFVVGGALFETGMASTIGGFICKFSNSERLLMIAVFAISAIMSGFLSNAATHACLAPIVIGIAEKSRYSRSKLMVGLLFGGVLGANISLLGQPHNMVGQTTLQESFGLSYGVFDIARIGIPILIIAGLYLAFYAYKKAPVRVVEGETSNENEEAKFAAVPSWKKWFSFAVLVVVVLGMIFEKQIGISFYILAAVGATLLVMSGVITPKQAFKSVSLDIVLLLGSMLTVSAALTSTGASQVIADGIIGLLGEKPAPILVTFTLILMSAFFTNIMSNAATASMLLPIAASMASSLDVSPKAIIMAVVVGAALACGTPIAMPSNTMVAGLAGYSFKDTMKVGLPMVAIGIVVASILLPIVMP